MNFDISDLTFSILGEQVICLKNNAKDQPAKTTKSYYENCEIDSKRSFTPFQIKAVLQDIELVLLKVFLEKNLL